MSAITAQNSQPSLSERAYVQVRDRLVTLQIAPGAAINEEQLARELEVGRTPMREAIKRLENERLVVIFPRRGTFATDVNITDLTHISEVRAQLEPVAARAAAQRATYEQRRELDALAEEIGRAARSTLTSNALMQLDMRVHRAIYAAAQNPFLEDTLVRYDNLATRIWCLFIDRIPSLGDHVYEHARLLIAITSEDADLAERLSAQHVAHFEQAIRAAL